ncbi:MAG: putative NAD/FAD-binding protein [Lentisphaeria bacterium]|jgi:predicted NAD/FAD-binding protein
MRIAIIGSGISGLTSAYLLKPHHDITVFEAEDRIGGHTATKDVTVNGESYAIDTGFIVYNDWTYPNFIKLLTKLGVPTRPTTMGFSVSCDATGLEYAGHSFSALFAQRSNLLRPSHLRMLLDIVRFNKEAIADLESGKLLPDDTLGDYLTQRGYSEKFISHYLVPMGSAIWSASSQDMLDFPLLFFVRFFKNHGLLSVKNRPQWRVISEGSRAYLEPLTASFRNDIRVSSRISSVTRTSQGVEVCIEGKQAETFDQVVFACHSSQALSMIKDPSNTERQVLEAIPYKNNDVVLHTDERLLPKKKLTWSSWNYLLKKSRQPHEPAVLTYNMNILQCIKSPVTFCVTLNGTDHIDPSKILGRYQYEHPVFSLDSVAASAQWSRVNGVNRSWFCGAYWGNGFHEDGVVSALKVTQGLGGDW